MGVRRLIPFPGIGRMLVRVCVGNPADLAHRLRCARRSCGIIRADHEADAAFAIALAPVVRAAHSTAGAHAVGIAGMQAGVFASIAFAVLPIMRFGGTLGHLAAQPHKLMLGCVARTTGLFLPVFCYIFGDKHRLAHRAPLGGDTVRRFPVLGRMRTSIVTKAAVTTGSGSGVFKVMVPVNTE